MYFKKQFFLFVLPVVLFVGVCFHTSPVRALTTLNTCSDIQGIDNDLAEDYILGGDIDCTGFTFTSLGSFTGTLDGDGYAIQHLTITGISNDHGLFSHTNGATIKHLAITDANMQGNYQFGILAATAEDTTVLDVAVEGTLFSGAALSLTGGMFGRMSGGSITHGTADIVITGYEYVGGLVGSTSAGAIIEKSSATGTITTFATSGNSSNGGLVGEHVNASINNSYADVIISASGDIVGGLVGISQGTSSITNSYAVGSVASTSNVSIGGLVGSQINSATTTQSYWDTQTTGQATSADGEGKTTLEMQDQDTFVNWNFNSIWNIDTGEYPTLSPYIRSSSVSSSTPTRSRAFFGYLMGKSHAPAGKENEFGRTLRTGSVGEDVRSLQVFLNAQGFPVAQTGRGFLGNETIFFGPKTQQALIAFQEAHASEILTPYGLAKGTGIFGESTRTLVTALLHK